MNHNVHLNGFCIRTFQSIPEFTIIQLLPSKKESITFKYVHQPTQQTSYNVSITKSTDEHKLTFEDTKDTQNKINMVNNIGRNYCEGLFDENISKLIIEFSQSFFPQDCANFWFKESKYIVIKHDDNDVIGMSKDSKRSAHAFVHLFGENTIFVGADTLKINQVGNIYNKLFEYLFDEYDQTGIQWMKNIFECYINDQKEPVQSFLFALSG
eukprot:207427_1